MELASSDCFGANEKDVAAGEDAGLSVAGVELAGAPKGNGDELAFDAESGLEVEPFPNEKDLIGSVL